jgi:hypothetical protein
VLAHRQGIVLGAFRPDDWVPSTKANVPWHNGDESRWGFVCKEAEPETAKHYLHKRVPDTYRAKGAANPVRFVVPQAAAD